MDFLRIGTQITKFEDLLKQILAKLEKLENQSKNTTGRIEQLEKKVTALGRACGGAFQQTKVVINALKEKTEELGESFDEYGGIIQDSTFDW